MDKQVESYINEVLGSTHSVGYVTYNHIFNKFDHLTLSKAKMALLEYANKYEDQEYVEMYDVTTMFGKGTVENQIMDGDSLDKIVDTLNEEDIELIGLCKTHKEFIDYCGEKDIKSSTFLLKTDQNEIVFEPNPNPIRNQQRAGVISDTQASALAKSTKQKVENKVIKDNTNYRNVDSKAGTQKKATNYFQKVAKSQNLTKEKAPETPIESSKIESEEEVHESQNDTKIGKKRKFDDIEQDLSDKLTISNNKKVTKSQSKINIIENSQNDKRSKPRQLSDKIVDNPSIVNKVNLNLINF